MFFGTPSFCSNSDTFWLFWFKKHLSFFWLVEVDVGLYAAQVGFKMRYKGQFYQILNRAINLIEDCIISDFQNSVLPTEINMSFIHDFKGNRRLF